MQKFNVLVVSLLVAAFVLFGCIGNSNLGEDIYVKVKFLDPEISKTLITTSDCVWNGNVVKCVVKFQNVGDTVITNNGGMSMAVLSVDGCDVCSDRQNIPEIKPNTSVEVQFSCRAPQKQNVNVDIADGVRTTAKC